MSQHFRRDRISSAMRREMGYYSAAEIGRMCGVERIWDYIWGGCIEPPQHQLTNQHDEIVNAGLKYYKADEAPAIQKAIAKQKAATMKYERWESPTPRMADGTPLVSCSKLSELLGMPVITVMYWRNTGKMPDPKHKWRSFACYTYKEAEKIRQQVIKSGYYEKRKRPVPKKIEPPKENK